MHDNRIDLFENFRDQVINEFGSNADGFAMYLAPFDSDENGSATMMVDKIAFKSNDLGDIVREAAERLQLQAGLIETDSSGEYAYAELEGDFTLLWVSRGLGDQINLMVSIR